MRSMMRGLTPLLLVATGLGCSSHSASSSHNDGGKGSEAGALDGASVVPDGARRLDVRDSGGLDQAVSEAGAVRDARDAAIDAQPRDARDGGIDASAIDSRDGARDVNPDGKRDGNLDLRLDVPVDTAPVRGTCASPIEIPNELSHADLSVRTSGAQHVLDFPCADNGADMVFRIQSTQTELAYADTFGTAWNTALFFSDTCDSPNPPEGADMAVCNDDACGTSQSQAFATLAYGYHYLIVSGVGGDNGDVTVHFQHAPIGNGPLVSLPQGSGTVTGTTDGMDSSRTCDTSGPKNSYWWVNCPSDLGGAFHASTCNGADWDTVLILQIPRLESLSCQDDDQTCGMQSTVDTSLTSGAGISLLSVAGTLLESYGDYTVTYTRP